MATSNAYSQKVIKKGIITSIESAYKNISASASGTVTTTTIGAYTIHTFTGNGTLTILSAPEGTSIEYLIVAGGGASGYTNTGGGGTGGAGGGGGTLMWYDGAIANGAGIGPAFPVRQGDVITVTVGTGGPSTANNSLAYNGTDTTISSGRSILRVNGGGGGGPGYNQQGLPNNGASAGACGSSLKTTYDPTGPYPYQPGMGQLFKQGNPNGGAAGGAGGVMTGPAPYTTGRTGMANYLALPGLALRTSFGGTYQSYGGGGSMPTTATPVTSSSPGFGGQPKTATGVGANGAAGIVIFRYISSPAITVVSGIEMLLVGGGAGNSTSQYRAAGGAGGLVYFGAETPKTPNGSTLSLYSGTYAVIVGAAGAPTQVTDSLGNATSFVGAPCGQLASSTMNRFGITASIDAYGGGSYSGSQGDYNGSGQGATSVSNYGQFQGIADPNQGKNGGAQVTYNGGGGGAGAVGGDGSATKAGDGGAGLTYSISGTATNYAGGGGGVGTNTIGTRGIGATSYGGGTAAYVLNNAGGSGTANTGGGAGGTYTNNGSVSASGGSGVLILRYPSTYPDALATTGLAVGYPITSGGYKIYKWNSSGTITF
jgi:hypothetical protein